MEKNRKTLLRYLTDVNATLERIRELEERIASKTFRLTPSYESIGGGRSSGNTNKVERYVDEMIEIEEELAKCKNRLLLIDYIREEKVLTKLEYELIEWLQLGGSMSEFARTHNIYKSYVYKIRDNALEKMMKFVQVTPKCSDLWVKC